MEKKKTYYRKKEERKSVIYNVVRFVSRDFK